MIGTFAPHGPERCSGLPVRRYGPHDLARELGAAFELIEHQAQDHDAPAGAVQSFTWCRFRRA